MTIPPPPSWPLPSAFPLPTAPPPPFVDEDLPCRTCSYNLRTLPTDGVCPECATPVAASLTRDLLRGSDPHWLKTLRFAAMLIIYGAMVSWVGGNRLGYRAPLMYFALASLAVEFLGVWLITLPDPSGIGEPRLRNLRVAARSCFIARLAIGMFWFVAVTAHIGSLFVLRFSTPYVEQATYGLSVVLLLAYLARLIERIPGSNLPRGLRWGAGAFALLAVIQIASTVFFSAMVRRYFVKNPAMLPGVFWVFSILSLAGLVAMVLFVGLISRCRIAIGREADLA